MPANMIVSQAAAVLNSLQHQATGAAALTAINTPADFISAAQTLLRTGYDPIVNALSQMWGRTIYAVRDYSAPFARLEMDAERWGNATRKISFADRDITDDDRFTYPVGYDANQTPENGDGLSANQYALRKPDVQQVAFYGQSVYQDWVSIFRDNLDVAFTGPEEFVRFNAAEVQNRSNKLEQYRETTRRGLLANAAGAILDENQAGRVIHVLTEYNTVTGQSLSATDVMGPDYFPDFVRWLYGRITTLGRMMSRRSNKFQTMIGGKVINRHTPADKLEIYISSPFLDQINSRVRSTTYHDDYLQDANWEGVDFWQSIDSPMSINIKPTYTAALTGEQITAGTAVNNSVVLGMMFDTDALGYAIVNYWTSVTPFNARGGYWNDWFHANIRTRFDNTEKMVVLTLD